MTKQKLTLKNVKMCISMREISHGPLLNVQRYMVRPYKANISCFYRIKGEKIHTKEPNPFLAAFYVRAQNCRLIKCRPPD